MNLHFISGNFSGFGVVQHFLIAATNSLAMDPFYLKFAYWRKLKIDLCSVSVRKQGIKFFFLNAHVFHMMQLYHSCACIMSSGFCACYN
jgi:hypothetical protein